MVDWSLTEFSRLRLQYSYSRALEGVSDNQLFLQYIREPRPARGASVLSPRRQRARNRPQAASPRVLRRWLVIAAGLAARRDRCLCVRTRVGCARGGDRRRQSTRLHRHDRAPGPPPGGGTPQPARPGAQRLVARLHRRRPRGRLAAGRAAPGEQPADPAGNAGSPARSGPPHPPRCTQVLDRSLGDVHPAGNPHVQYDPRNIARVANVFVRAARDDRSAERRRLSHPRRGLPGALARRDRGLAAGSGALARDESDLLPPRHDLPLRLARYRQRRTLEPKPGSPPAAGDLAVLVSSAHGRIRHGSS